MTPNEDDARNTEPRSPSTEARRLVADHIRSLSGFPCWSVRQGGGSFVTFEFGAPRLEVREPIPHAKVPSLRRRLVTVRGEHHLWIEQCDWSLLEHDQPIAHSESERAVLSEALARLDGAKLRAVRLCPSRGGTDLQFEFDFALRLERCVDSGPDAPIWHLWSGDRVLSLLASGQLELGQEDEKSPRRFSCDVLALVL